jgi:hypothetical protein
MHPNCNNLPTRVTPIARPLEGSEAGPLSPRIRTRPATVSHCAYQNVQNPPESSQAPRQKVPNIPKSRSDWTPRLWVPPLTRGPRATDLGRPQRKSDSHNSRSAVGSLCFLPPPPSQFRVPHGRCIPTNCPRLASQEGSEPPVTLLQGLPGPQG